MLPFVFLSKGDKKIQSPELEIEQRTQSSGTVLLPLILYRRQRGSTVKGGLMKLVTIIIKHEIMINEFGSIQMVPGGP